MTAFLMFCLAATHLEEGLWVKFEPERAGFSVMVPGIPWRTGQVNEEYEVDCAEAEVVKGTCKYTAQSARVEQRSLDLTTPDSLSQMLIKCFFLDHGAQIVEDKKVTVGSITVRQLLIEFKNQDNPHFVKFHICLLNKCYVVMLEANSKVKSDLESAEARQFFASFKVTGKR